MTNNTPKTHRRSFRHSFRRLLLLVLLIAVSLGWTIHKARQQGIAVAALKEMGCEVEYDEATRSPTILERLRKLLGDDEFRSVSTLRCHVQIFTDAGLEHLRGLTLLQKFSCRA